MSVSDPRAYQIGPYSGVPRSVLEGPATSTLAELLEGIDPSTTQSVTAELPEGGWRLWRTKPTARGGRQQVWLAAVQSGWVNIAITDFDDGRRLLSAFTVEPDQALPSREDRREGLSLGWIETEVELVATQVETHSFWFDLRNNTDQTWLNIADDEDSVLVRVADVSGYYMDVPGTVLNEIPAGGAVTVSGHLQVADGQSLKPGTYPITGQLDSLGLSTPETAQLRIIA